MICIVIPNRSSTVSRCVPRARIMGKSSMDVWHAISGMVGGINRDCISLQICTLVSDNFRSLNCKFTRTVCKLAIKGRGSKYEKKSGKERKELKSNFRRTRLQHLTENV